MKKGTVLLMVFLSICFVLKVQGQDDKSDSLWRIYKQAKHDTTRIRLLLDIGDVFRYQITDTAFYYYNTALELTEQAMTTSHPDKRFSDDYKDDLLSLKAKSLRYIGIVHENQGSYDKAMENYLKSLKISEELGYKKGIAICYNNIGIVCENQGSYDKAMENYLMALKIDKELSNKKGMANCYSNIGNIHGNQGSYDKAIKNYLKSLKIDEELGYKKGMAMSYSNIGVIHWNQGSYEKAIEIFLKSLRIFYELGYKIGMAKCYNNIGAVQYDQGSYDKAMENFLKSLKIKEELGDKKGVAFCYINIGVVYKNQGSYDKAVENYLKALIIFEKMGYRIGMAMCNSSNGIVHCKQGSYDKAMENYLKALIIYRELGDKEGMSACYNNFGLVHLNQGSYNKAIENYLKSLKIKEELGDKNGIAIIYDNIAALHIILADTCKSPGIGGWTAHLDTALEYANKAYDLAVEIGALPMQNDASAHLQKAYTKLGRYKEAVKYAEIFIVTRDSMFSEEKTKALAEMTTKYETEKKDQEIELLNKEKKIQELNLEQKTYQSYLSYSIVGLGFILVIIIYCRYRAKQKANILLAEQKEQLEKFNTELIAKNKLISGQKKEIEIRVREKEIMLRELHHRVKNNLQVIYSMLSLQANKIKDKDVVSALEANIHRVWAMSLIHHKLYLDENLTQINMPQYINELSATILETNSKTKQQINMKFDIQNINLEADLAIPLGLIINELLSNALKHAFKDVSAPELNIQLKGESNHNLVLNIKDNGIGIPEDVDPNKSGAFGLELINMLVKQLKGKMEITNRDGAC
ncbi:MAG: tetratricopeptide repeat protein, partial [Bacteroidales bacterium]|nr:tetratricopeptide repeat protein [Bacteroidales bacterium]